MFLLSFLYNILMGEVSPAPLYSVWAPVRLKKGTMSKTPRSRDGGKVGGRGVSFASVAALNTNALSGECALERYLPSFASFSLFFFFFFWCVCSGVWLHDLADEKVGSPQRRKPRSPNCCFLLLTLSRCWWGAAEQHGKFWLMISWMMLYECKRDIVCVHEGNTEG